jgi:hypothetical protein
MMPHIPNYPRKRNLRARSSAAVGCAVVLLAAVFGPAPAAASAHHPTAEFLPFGDCPLENPAVTICTVASLTGGEVIAGKKSVPITAPIELQGGLHSNEITEELEFIEAEGGPTLSQVALPVPGGLLGIVAPRLLPTWMQASLTRDGSLGVTATLELAGPASAIKLNASNLLEEERTALQLPAKVKLSNPFLGNDCYIGSESHPVVMNLTSGTTSPPPPNRPITGNSGRLTILDGAQMIVLNGGLLVDNGWAAPVASGCGGAFSALVDPAVDAELGLPSPAGHNAAILHDTLAVASAMAARESE